MDINDLKELYQKEESALLKDWKELLKFKSISTDPEYDRECFACADWLVKKIENIGFKGEIIQSDGKPIVYGEYKSDPSAPTLLFYGHYDVQPPDPLDLWKSPPFEPEIRDGRLYARGASDNKGQVTFVLAALDHLIKAGELKVNVKLLIEGEEESGSGGLSGIINKLGDKFKSDLLYVSDTSMAENPTITMGLRGIASLSVTFNGCASDVHSGLYGGAIRNPVTELARIISTLHSEDGRVAIAGFYDDLIDPTLKESELAKGGITKKDDLKTILGVDPVGGESNFHYIERIGFRPTVELNGFVGGYGGPGGKTIVPAKATAKISMRLGTGQDPERAVKLLKDHILSRVPNGLTVVFDYESAGGGAVRVDIESKWLSKAEGALKKLSDSPIVYRWEGGSIPIIEKIIKATGAEPIFVGFGKGEDNWHAPNESLAIERFKLGYLFSALFLSNLA